MSDSIGRLACQLNKLVLPHCTFSSRHPFFYHPHYPSSFMITTGLARPVWCKIVELVEKSGSNAMQMTLMAATFVMIFFSAWVSSGGSGSGRGSISSHLML